MDSKLQLVRLSENAKIPVRSTSEAAGYDLFSASSITLAPSSTNIVATDLCIKVPIGTYGRIAPRSGMALKGIHVMGGVIDRDYRDKVGIILHNLSDKEYNINIGDKIAQLILEKIESPEIVEVKNLEETDRKGGFGSTGK